jgi:predicted transcriptional regulator
MEKIKKLPDSELQLMKIIWANKPPISTNEIISNLDSNNSWKPQTVLTLLKRLLDKGFLFSERKGKERIYAPAIREQDYLQFETVSFLKKFHKNSLTSMINTLYDGEKTTADEIENLENFLREMRDK